MPEPEPCTKITKSPFCPGIEGDLSEVESQAGCEVGPRAAAPTYTAAEDAP